MAWVLTGKFILKSLVVIVLAIVLLLGVLIYIVSNGIPFIEGDTKIKTGHGFHFTIGMNKSEVFHAIKNKYNKEDYYLRVLREKSSDISSSLEGYTSNGRPYLANSPYYEWRAPIRETSELLSPLMLTSRWDINMPAEWVNSIYLEFDQDKLVEIRKSRWVFERP
jgi:hypothetical protein